MPPQTDGDYQKLITEVIKKQMVILGPDITLAKARNVQGLTVADDGSVTALSGNPQELIQKLVEQFVELSGMIVKKTMEPLLSNFPGLSITASATDAVQDAIQNQVAKPQPVQTQQAQSQPSQPTVIPAPPEKPQQNPTMPVQNQNKQI